MSSLDYAATSLNLKILFATLEGWGYMSAHPFFAMFAMSFAGYDWILEKKWAKAFFIFVPVTNTLWVTTNSLHGLVWRGFIQKADNVVVFVHGPAYEWIFVSSHLLTVIIIISLAIASFKGSVFSRRQGQILLASILFAEGTNIAYNLSFGVEGVDWTSVAFSVIGALFLWALYGQKFLDIVPIAREKLIDSLRDGMIVLDSQGRIVDMNPSAAKMMGHPSNKLLGRRIETLLHFPPSILDQPPDKEVRFELEVGGTSQRYFDVLISPLLNDNANVVGRLIIFRDNTEHKIIQDELQRLARTDALTGLFNRGYFFELTEKELAKSIRYNRPLSLILFDLDLFKEVNDKYGHRAGDQALISIGNLLRREQRESDIAARYGGEEFVLLLSETDINGAATTAERLRKLIEFMPVHNDEDTFQISGSFGVAGKELTSAKTIDELISQADQALYEAKRDGRNRVVCYR